MGSVFSHHSTNADRSASDRRRHKKKIEKAIKDGIHDIVAEESIIGQITMNALVLVAMPTLQKVRNTKRVRRKKAKASQTSLEIKRAKSSMKSK